MNFMPKLERESVPESKESFWERPLVTAIKWAVPIVLLAAAGVIALKSATVLRST